MEINYRPTAGLITASCVRMGLQHHKGQLLSRRVIPPSLLHVSFRGKQVESNLIWSHYPIDEWQHTLLH